MCLQSTGVAVRPVPGDQCRPAFGHSLEAAAGPTGDKVGIGSGEERREEVVLVSHSLIRTSTTT